MSIRMLRYAVAWFALSTNESDDFGEPMHTTLVSDVQK